MENCFDLLHVGHIRLLRTIKEQSDILVVALNSDSSIKRLKGEKRPILPLEERMEIISSIEYVDFVTFFDEDTPYKLIEQLKPQILAKGGDWQTSQIVGADIVLKNDGKILSINYEQGFSTTNIIEKIILLYCCNGKNNKPL